MSVSKELIRVMKITSIIRCVKDVNCSHRDHRESTRRGAVRQHRGSLVQSVPQHSYQSFLGDNHQQEFGGSAASLYARVELKVEISYVHPRERHR